MSNPSRPPDTDIHVAADKIEDIGFLDVANWMRKLIRTSGVDVVLYAARRGSEGQLDLTEIVAADINGIPIPYVHYVSYQAGIGRLSEIAITFRPDNIRTELLAQKFIVDPNG